MVGKIIKFFKCVFCKHDWEAYGGMAMGAERKCEKCGMRDLITGKYRT